MKTTENKGFGIIGIKVELSFVELLLIREQLSEVVQSDLLDMPRPMPERSALLNIVRFCEKLIYSNLGEAMDKAGEELFCSSVPCDPALSDEDRKNEADLNALENETPER